MNTFSPYTVRERSPQKLVLVSGKGRRFIISALLRFFPLLLLVAAIAYPLMLNGMNMPLWMVILLPALLLVIMFMLLNLKIPTEISIERMGISLQHLSTWGTNEHYFMMPDIKKITLVQVRARSSGLYYYLYPADGGKRVPLLNIPVHSKYNERKDAVTTELEQVMSIKIEIK